jgi:hypothetical protein
VKIRLQFCRQFHVAAKVARQQMNSKPEAEYCLLPYLPALRCVASVVRAFP